MHSVNNPKIKQEAFSDSESNSDSPTYSQIVSDKRKRETSNSETSSDECSSPVGSPILKSCANSSKRRVKLEVETKKSKSESFESGAAIKKVASQAEEAEKDLIEFYIQEAVKERDLRLQMSYKFEDQRVRCNDLTKTVTEIVETCQFGLMRVESKLKIAEMTNAQEDSIKISAEASSRQKRWAPVYRQERKQKRILDANKSSNDILLSSMSTILDKCSNLTKKYQKTHPLVSKSKKLTQFLGINTTMNMTSISSSKSKCSFTDENKNVRVSTRLPTADNKFIKVSPKKYIEPESLQEKSSFIEIEIPSYGFKKELIETTEKKRKRDAEYKKQAEKFEKMITDNLDLSKFKISQNSEQETIEENAGTDQKREVSSSSKEMNSSVP